jgi:hypothetical protein
MNLPTPAHLYLNTPEDKTPAVTAVVTLFLVMEAAESEQADLIPVTVTNEDGSEDVVLLTAVEHPDIPGQAGYGIAGVLFAKGGTSEAFLKYSAAVRELLPAALDADQAKHAELPDPDEFARSIGIDPETEG